MDVFSHPLIAGHTTGSVSNVFPPQAGVIFYGALPSDESRSHKPVVPADIRSVNTTRIAISMGHPFLCSNLPRYGFYGLKKKCTGWNVFLKPVKICVC